MFNGKLCVVDICVTFHASWQSIVVTYGVLVSKDNQFMFIIPIGKSGNIWSIEHSNVLSFLYINLRNLHSIFISKNFTFLFGANCFAAFNL